VGDPRLSPVSRAGGLSPVDGVRPATRPAPTAPAGGPSFAESLGGQLGIRFSAHAQARLDSRGVSFDSGQLARLQSGVDAAAAKGSREALVLVDSVACVVAVRNRTVVTALPHEDAGPAVFTNIDSAVIT
jgi:flagellar operon protein